LYSLKNSKISSFVFSGGATSPCVWKVRQTTVLRKKWCFKYQKLQIAEEEIADIKSIKLEMFLEESQQECGRTYWIGEINFQEQLQLSIVSLI
jgi:hypothetical protein